jgi:hypothetical protein
MQHIINVEIAIVGEHCRELDQGDIAELTGNTKHLARLGFLGEHIDGPEGNSGEIGGHTSALI